MPPARFTVGAGLHRVTGLPQSLLLRLEQLSPETRRRLGGIAFTLAVQVVFIALLLSMAPDIVRRKVVDMVTFSISMAPDDKAPEPAEAAPEEAKESESEAAPPEQVKEAPTPPKPPEIQLPPVETTTAIETLPPPAPPAPPSPPAPPKRVYGPPDLRPKSGMYADTPRVEGSGPNGEPLYAAAWFREPYDDELAGFLSTATSRTGYGTVACRTVPKYRVQDCVIVDEYPPGSGFGRAVQAAAWQFLVRPPQKGGNPMVGEWVQIRIYSGMKKSDRWGQ